MNIALLEASDKDKKRRLSRLISFISCDKNKFLLAYLILLVVLLQRK